MRLDKLAVTAQEAFQASMGVAGDAQSSTIEPIHLLKAMLDASENNLSAIIKRIGADPGAAVAKRRRRHRRHAEGQRLHHAYGHAQQQPYEGHRQRREGRPSSMGDSYATTEHLLIALARGQGRRRPACSTALGVTGKTVEEAYSSLRGDTRVTDSAKQA